MPDLVIGPFDDAVIAALAGCAEVVLFVIRVISKPSNSRQNSQYTDYQHNNQNTTYSNNTNYQYYNQNNESSRDSDNKDDEFQFFAGCANWDQVKTRYRELMKIYHPDAGGHEEASKKINAEYNMLKKKFGH